MLGFDKALAVHYWVLLDYAYDASMMAVCLVTKRCYSERCLPSTQLLAKRFLTDIRKIIQ